MLLESQVNSQEIYPYHNIKSKVESVKESLVFGHFPYWFCKNIDDQFDEAFKITVLREPTERYLSFLRAKKKRDGLPDLESVFRLRGNYYCSMGLVDNAMCRYLTKDPLLEEEALLESAKRTLHELDCVIFFDHFDTEVKDLFYRFGIELSDGDIPKLNSTKLEPVSVQLLDEIRSLNELDIQLYQYAKQHIRKKETCYTLRVSSSE
jgi:hypothetical protein